jgi:Tfp pilus assembly protein PilF/hemolysin-activating ACP:hemolysin acyltransferase
MTDLQTVASQDSATRPSEPPGGFKDFLQVASEKLKQGDAQSALRAASEACHAAPDHPHVHYTYGECWLALSEPAQAERAFARALNLNPAWVDAWINFGVARYRQGRIEEAKAATRQALAHAPSHPVATANLGAFMRITGDGEGSEAMLREAILREPANGGARLNLVADLLQSERSTEALELLDAAAPPPDDVQAQRHWHLQRSLALLQLERPTEARAALDAFAALGLCPPELAALALWRLVLLALADNAPKRAVAEAERMEQALANVGAKALPEHRIMAHFDLAKFWSGRNDRARAFRHWKQGHALLKPSQPFSRENHAAFVDANIAAFTTARLRAGRRASNRDAAPVFIVGMPRSGTTLCEQILAAHRDVYGSGERNALPRAFAALGAGRDDEAASVERIANLDADALDVAAAQYLAELHALAPDKARILDKLPANYSYLGLIGLMLPGAKIIYCERDPRDIGLSIFSFRFHGYHPYAHDLADLGWTIGQHGRLMDHWRTVLPDAIMTVKLSDWVEDFDGTLARVLRHLDLPPDPNCARFYEGDSRVRTVSYAQVRQPVNARGLGRWKAYAAELAPLIGELHKAGMVPADAVTAPDDSAPTRAADAGISRLTVWKPDDPAVALGFAAEFLMRHTVFAKFEFGEWTRALVGLIRRGHFFFVVDERQHVHAMLGWALTDEFHAEEWVGGRSQLDSENCGEGDCVIISVLAAASAEANRVLTVEGIKVLAGKRMFYAQRYYANGRIRPLRIRGEDLRRRFAAICSLPPGVQ